MHASAFKLIGLALLANAMATSGSTSVFDPGVPDCNNTCTASVVFVLGSGWAGTSYDGNNGTADWEHCDFCTQCDATVYLGWAGRGTAGFGGSHTIEFDVSEDGTSCIAIVETPCDGQSLGGIRGNAGGTPARADLYCPCVAH